jgi:hypothetical protein
MTSLTGLPPRSTVSWTASTNSDEFGDEFEDEGELLPN